MGAVLDVTRRPETFGRRVVALVEKRIERVQDGLDAVVFAGRDHGKHLAQGKSPQGPGVISGGYFRTSGICKLVGRFCSVSKPRPSILRAPQNNRSPLR